MDFGTLVGRRGRTAVRFERTYPHGALRERAEGPPSAAAAPWQAYDDEHVAAGPPSGAAIPAPGA